jgi:sodium/proline symporter
LVAIYSLIAIGGWQPLWSGVMARERALAPWFNGYSGVLAVALVVGVLFAGLASAAQPQVIARYFACRDELALRRARLIALSWSVFALTIALLIGWSARVLLSGQLSAGELLDALTSKTVPSAAAAFVSVAIVIAFAISCLSPWVATAVHLAMDLRGRQQAFSLLWCQVCVCLLGVLVGLAAIYLPAGNEDRLWLCWHALSAAFGPLLLVRLTGKKVRPASALGAMWSGFVLTALFHLMPDTPGDLLERSLPFIAAMGIALSGGDQRRNPNRADRGDKTIHDHLPI